MSGGLLARIISEPALHAGWRRVRENDGCAGADRVTIEDFSLSLDENLAGLASDVLTGTYAPLPLLQIVVDKGNGEGRRLSIPAVRDRVVQSAALEVLRPAFEQEAEACSFAYRPGLSVRNAAYEVQRAYEDGFRWVVDADIDAFFDSVDHGVLFERVGRLIPDADVRVLLALWVEGTVWDGRQLSRLRQGLPQGTAISPLLANLYLDEFDEALQSKRRRLVRYADDFLVLCKTREDAEQALELTEATLSTLKLTLDDKAVVSFDSGFRFLGILFCRSVMLVPFGAEPKVRRVLSFPPPLDMRSYLAGRIPIV